MDRRDGTPSDRFHHMNVWREALLFVRIVDRLCHFIGEKPPNTSDAIFANANQTVHRIDYFKINEILPWYAFLDADPIGAKADSHEQENQSEPFDVGRQGRT